MMHGKALRLMICSGQQQRRRTSLFLLLLAIAASLAACSKLAADEQETSVAASTQAASDSVAVTLEQMPRSEFERGHGEEFPAAASRRYVEPGDGYLKTCRMVFNSAHHAGCLNSLVARGVLLAWRTGFYTGYSINDAPWDVYVFKAAQHQNGHVDRIAGNIFWTFFCG